LTVLAVVLLITLLIVLISWGRLPPFVAFIAVALISALWFGMPLDRIAKSLERGVGDMLGGLAAIICLGAMFGRTIADSGAARSIANALIGVVGARFILIALALTGLIVGIPLFYAVGFVVLVPLVFSVGTRTKIPAVVLAIPLLCGLSVAHGFLPPHPSPVAIVKVFGADLGLTLIYGAVVAGVTVMIAGPLLAMTLKRMGPPTAVDQGMGQSAPEAPLPGAFNSCSTALLPVALIAAATAFAYVPVSSPLFEADHRLHRTTRRRADVVADLRDDQSRGSHVE